MIPFSPPYIRQEAIDEVVDTLRSGWITTGQKTKRFEREITGYCGCGTTVCVNSATFGLELILRWFGIGEGDEVIVPAYTYSASGNVVVHTGARLVLADVSSNDFNIRAANIEKLINERTKAVIPVDIAGVPCHYDEIMQLVSSEKNTAMFRPANEIQKKLGRILVLSDAAHSFGAVYKGRKTGCLADISVFSFHAVKNLTTAEGGAICTGLPDIFNNIEVYRILNTMSLHGQSKDALAKVSTGGWKYDIIDCGYKGNMTDIQASLGLVGLKYYDGETIPRRKDIFNKYHDRFKDKKWAVLPETSDGSRETSYHIYMLRVNGIDEQQRDLIMQEIAANEVAVNVHFQPLPLLTAFKTRGYKMEDYPVAYNNFKCEITLPVNEIITDEQVDEVAAAVTEAVKKVTGWS